MSMHYGAEQGFGMFLNLEEAQAFKRAAVLHPIDDAYKDSVPTDEGDIEFEMEDVAPTIGATDLDDDDCDIRRVWHLDGKVHPEDDDLFVNGTFIYGRKQGSVLRNTSLVANTYASLEEMAEEFKHDYGTWLPEDFDYPAHMAELVATNFG